MTLTRRTLYADIGTYVAYLAIFIFFAGPLLWLFSLSIRNSGEVYVSDLRLWPREPTLANFDRTSCITRCFRSISGTG